MFASATNRLIADQSRWRLSAILNASSGLELSDRQGSRPHQVRLPPPRVKIDVAVLQSREGLRPKDSALQVSPSSTLPSALSPSGLDKSWSEKPLKAYDRISGLLPRCMDYGSATFFKRAEAEPDRMLRHWPDRYQDHGYIAFLLACEPGLTSKHDNADRAISKVSDKFAQSSGLRARSQPDRLLLPPSKPSFSAKRRNSCRAHHASRASERQAPRR
jgi:hypothetical protein